jgi:hypothetical protein
MAEAARRNAGGPEAPGWGDVRRQMMVAAQAVMSSLAAYLAAGGDDSAPPAAMAFIAIGVLEELGASARRLEWGEEFTAEACARAVDEDREAWPRPRGYPLRAV